MLSTPASASRGKLPGRRQLRPHPGALINRETGLCHNDLLLFNVLSEQPPKEAETRFIDASATPAALSFSAQRFRANSAGPWRRGIVQPPRPTLGSCAWKTRFIDASATPAALSFSAQRFRANSAGPWRRGIVQPPRPTLGSCAWTKEKALRDAGPVPSSRQGFLEKQPLQRVRAGAALINLRSHSWRAKASIRDDGSFRSAPSRRAEGGGDAPVGVNSPS